MGKWGTLALGIFLIWTSTTYDHTASAQRNAGEVLLIGIAITGGAILLLISEAFEGWYKEKHKNDPKPSVFPERPNWQPKPDYSKKPPRRRSGKPSR